MREISLYGSFAETLPYQIGVLLMKKSFQAIAASCALAALLALPGCGSQSGAGGKVYLAAHAEATDFTGKLY